MAGQISLRAPRRWSGGGVLENTYLAFNEVSNASLRHDGNSDGLHDLLDHAGVGHTGDATLDADISGNTLESHDGGGTGLLSNAGLQKRTDMSARCNHYRRSLFKSVPAPH